MRMQLSSIVMTIAISGVVQARTAPEIAAALQSIAPPGKYLKAAFLRGNYANFATQVNNGNVFVVSSKDGNVRKINTVTGKLAMVNLTVDGKRVLFHNFNSSKTYVVDWEGTNQREIASSGYLGEYWYDKLAKKHYALIVGNGIWRLNIDNPSEKAQVTTKECGGLGTGLSDDGTRVIIYDEKGWGIQLVGTNTVSRGSGGCQASMRAGSLIQWSCNESGHANSIVNNVDGTIAFKISMANPPGTGEGGRFTQDPDLFTYMKTANGDNSTLSGNPVIYRVSDKKTVYLLDDVKNTEFCGDMDIVSLDDSNVAVSIPTRMFNNTHAWRIVTDARHETYSVDGRRRYSMSKSGHRSPIVHWRKRRWASD